MSQPVFSVTQPPYGATGDGVTDDTEAINAALIAAHAAGGGIVFFPAGHYLVSGTGILLRASDTVLRGEGAAATVVRAAPDPTGTAIPAVVQSSASFRRERVAVEDLSLDGETHDAVNCLVVDGDHVDGLAVRRCGFLVGTGNGLSLLGVSDARVEASHFYTSGTANGTGVLIARGGSATTISGNRFRWLHNGLIVDTHSSLENPGPGWTTTALSVERNEFDLGWWLLPVFAGLANEGEAVTYTSTTLTDPTAAFAGLRLGGAHNVRATPVFARGVIGEGGSRQVVDPDAVFLTAGVRRGHIVRSGGRMAVVAAVASGEVLQIEEWWDEATRAPVPPPVAGETYTVHGVYLGLIESFTPTDLTVSRWHDLDGNSVVPAHGTRYEVMRPRPNYAIHLEAGAEDTLITGNLLRRGWSDQISVFGTRSRVVANVIEDGEDMGITIHGWDNVVTHNVIRHQGAGGIYAECQASIIEDNTLEGPTPWVNNLATTYLAHLMIRGAGNSVARNTIVGRARAGLDRYGISFSGDGSDNYAVANPVIGVARAAYWMFDAVTGNVVEGLPGQTVAHRPDVAVGQRYALTGVGPPEGVVTAGPESTYYQSDADLTWRKQRGTGSTGWAVAS